MSALESCTSLTLDMARCVRECVRSIPRNISVLILISCVEASECSFEMIGRDFNRNTLTRTCTPRCRLLSAYLVVSFGLWKYLGPKRKHNSVWLFCFCWRRCYGRRMNLDSCCLCINTDIRSFRLKPNSGSTLVHILWLLPKINSRQTNACARRNDTRQRKKRKILQWMGMSAGK